MSKLDSYVFNIIYSQCKNLGALVGQGAFEGLVMYAGIITAEILKLSKNRK